jgi:hypothetical protein
MILIGAATLQTAASRVPLEAIHTDPSQFEGRTLVTCGEAYPGKTILYLRGWHRGKSRGGMRMD